MNTQKLAKRSTARKIYIDHLEKNILDGKYHQPTVKKLAHSIAKATIKHNG